MRVVCIFTVLFIFWTTVDSFHSVYVSQPYRLWTKNNRYVKTGGFHGYHNSQRPHYGSYGYHGIGLHHTYNHMGNYGRKIPQENKVPITNNASLAFVVDSTGSMFNEIRQVRDGIKQIFDSMMKYPQTRSQNYVLVFFNDPLVGPYWVSKDPWEFMKHLHDLKVNGGSDCEERSLKGLKLAIERSLPGSYIFLFTDAGAKDHELLPELEASIQQKRCQVIFVLTGDCGTQNSDDFLVYKRIAATSSGQVFNLKEVEVQKVIEYVNYTINERNKVNFVSEDMPGPGRETFVVPLDTDTNSLTVSMTGKDPVIHVKNPYHREVYQKPILHVNTAVVLNIPHPNHGNWSVDVGSTSDHHVRISGSSKFFFSYGFSNSPTIQTDKVSWNPEIGMETYVFIRVTPHSQLYNLTKVQLRKHTRQIIQELDLHLVGGQSNLYRSVVFLPPQEQFYLQILGTDRNGFTVERTTPTAIIPTTKEPPPVVHVVPSTKLILGEKQEIECRVESKLNYTVSWSKRSTIGKYLLISDPRFIIKATGNLEINPVTNGDGGWYKCTAESAAGKNENNVSAEVIKPDQESTPIKVSITRKTVYFQEGDTFNLTCKVVGPSKLVLQWRKGQQLIQAKASQVTLPGEEHIFNLSVLNANESDGGRYQCVARNNLGQDIDEVYAYYMVRPYVSNDASYDINTLENTPTILPCGIQGKPKPTITWLKNWKKIDAGETYQVLSNGSLLIQQAKVSDSGSYTCIGQNQLGKEKQTINLNVGSPSDLIEIPADTIIPITSNGSIPCNMKGEPQPTVNWQRRDGKPLDESRFTVGDSCTLVISDAKYEDRGAYILTLENIHGLVEISVNVNISGVEAPVMDIIHQNLKVYKGETIEFYCNARGQPPPTYRWIAGDSPVTDYTDSKLTLQDVSLDESGTYECEASNVAGKAKKTFKLTVVDNEVQAQK